MKIARQQFIVNIEVWVLRSSFRNTLDFENRTIFKGDTANYVRQSQLKNDENDVIPLTKMT